MSKTAKTWIIGLLSIAFIVIVVVFLVKVVKLDEIILKKMYPTKYAEYVYSYAKDYDVDPLLMFAIIKSESNFNPEVTSSSNAIGLMQLMEPTAKEVIENMQQEEKYVTNSSLYDPKTNIMVGIKYYASLEEHFGGNKLLALTAYNAGMGNVMKWISDGVIKEDGSDIENIPFKETNTYVRKIIRDYKMYKQLYGQEKRSNKIKKG